MHNAVQHLDKEHVFFILLQCRNIQRMPSSRFSTSFTTIVQVSCITTFSFLSCSTEARAKWPWLCLTRAPLPCYPGHFSSHQPIALYQVRALPGHCFSVASVHPNAPIDACNRGFRVIRAIASRFSLPDRPCRETSNLVTVTPHRQKNWLQCLREKLSLADLWFPKVHDQSECCSR